MAAYHPIEGNNYLAAYEGALVKLDQLKDQTLGGAPLMALPIVKQCRSTGLAACHVQGYEDYCLGREAITKRMATNQALGRMRRVLKELDTRYDFVPDFSGYEISHLALVHIDGDGMGDLLIEVIKGCPDEEKLKDYLRDFSTSLQAVTNGAYKQMVQRLIDLVEREEFLKPWRDRGLLPIRPIIYGGDDVTFITLGPLGLTLAAEYLRGFSNSVGVKLHGQYTPVTASAGVAIIPAKFPFARGHGLAADLCSSAKDKRRKEGRGGGWLDFQLVHGAITGDLASLRATLYAHREKKRLLSRPYQVCGNKDV
ncbi:MAG TPA: hypothetical protein GXX57_09465 [Firmicutes bacterium]|nr:hypothetical protein [Bacillota bacterium]